MTSRCLLNIIFVSFTDDVYSMNGKDKCVRDIAYSLALNIISRTLSKYFTHLCQ